MKTKKQRIIEEWNKTKTVEVHPTYRQVAKAVGVEVSYAFRIIKQYLKQ